MRQRRFLAFAAAGLFSYATAVAGPLTRVELNCRVLYEPQHRVWVRTVILEAEGQESDSLSIDGLKPYRHTLRGSILSTAIDNERIRIDLVQGLWESDFRGLATGRGQCIAGP